MGTPAPLGVAASGTPPSGDIANSVLSGVFIAPGPSAPFAFRGPMNVALFASVTDALTVTAGSLNATVASAGDLAAGDAINSALVPPGTTIGAIDGTSVTLALPPISLFGFPLKGQSKISQLALTAGLNGAGVSGPYVASGTTVSGIAAAAQAPVGTGSIGTPGIINLSADLTGMPPNSTPNLPYVFTPNGNAILASGTDDNASFTGAAIKFTGSVQLERSFDGGKTWIVCNVGADGTLAVYTDGTPVSFAFGEPERSVLYRLNCTALSAGNINYRISTTGQAAEVLAVGQLA